jgi:hypothetical protein
MGKAIRRRKPDKPYEGFPLFPHATRRWAKKINGKLHYFGPWNDWQKALAKYQEQKDDLHAGRTPRVQGDGFTIRDLLNRFLTAKKLLLIAGGPGPRRRMGELSASKDSHPSALPLVAGDGSGTARCHSQAAGAQRSKPCRASVCHDPRRQLVEGFAGEPGYFRDGASAQEGWRSSARH